MTLLKYIPVVLGLALATTCSPSPNGSKIRGRNYESTSQSEVNPTTRQEVDPRAQVQISQNFGFHIPAGSIPRSFGPSKKRGGRAQASFEVLYSNEDNYFDPKYGIGRIRSRDQSVAAHRNDGEYGYNYQGGEGDVQIHQHIHEYVFSDQSTGGACENCRSFCEGNGSPFKSCVNGNCQCGTKKADCSIPQCDIFCDKHGFPRGGCDGSHCSCGSKLQYGRR